MKTEFPDLERLPKENFWKHLLWFWWNRPGIFVEDLYGKYVLKQKMDKEMAKEKEMVKEMEVYKCATEKLELLEENICLKMKINELTKNILEK
jgi:hypothetical protein|tara:strand:- start:2226 stop:2504 length:279 start_codon:yes stop_codon:yes gene_type:complete